MSTEKDNFGLFVSGNNALSFDLLTLAEVDEDQNLFISPASLYMALSLAYNGADSATKQEMDKVLHLHEKWNSGTQRG